jgi:hypothetical protein
MLGLDAAGKTTILYKLHIGEVLSTVPTIGMSPLYCGIFFKTFACCKFGDIETYPEMKWQN